MIVGLEAATKEGVWCETLSSEDPAAASRGRGALMVKADGQISLGVVPIKPRGRGYLYPTPYTLHPTPYTLNPKL